MVFNIHDTRIERIDPRIEEEEFRRLWRQHVDTIIPLLAEHLDRFDLVIDEVERFIETWRNVLNMGAGHNLEPVQMDRFEHDARELEVRLRTSSAPIFRDLQQLTIQDLPYVRQQLLEMRISEALLSEIGL
jgi:hypothetical protein